METHEKPFKAQVNLEYLNDMGNELVLESGLKTDVHAHIAKPTGSLWKRRREGR